MTLGNPTLTSELKERLAAGITAETAGRGIAELAAWRDRFLVDLLALRAGQKYRAPTDHVVVVSRDNELPYQNRDPRVLVQDSWMGRAEIAAE